MTQPRTTSGTRKSRSKASSPHYQLLKANRHRYEALLAAQNGHCALCPREPKNRRLDMDHDHKRMVIRGLLCHRCNRALANWMTSGWLAAAATYVDGEV